ncbi:MAG: hypothetical protein A4E19_12755 [Nitrospira sp. SG-bin1]|nr:MAG: hypothetical protein A4E19_12755 [Nitrospira sp. SG-bin1]
MNDLRTGFVGTIAVLLMVVGAVDMQAATEPSTIAPGGGKSPATGGRPDEQGPRLGTGNRGTGEPGRPLIDPSQIRSAPSGPGTVIGQVLSIVGDTYIVRQPDGREVMLKSTGATDVRSVINMGETVEAQVDGAGVLTQIKPAGR